MQAGMADIKNSENFFPGGQEPQKNWTLSKKCPDYYAFGLTMPGRSSNTGNPNDNYKFTGHELDDEAGLNLYNANARMMDPMLGGRFLSIDPLAREFPNISPYAYGNNNPLRYTDPTGMAPMDWIKDLETDEYVWDNNVNSAEDTPEGFAYVGKSLDDVAADFDASTPGYDFWSKPNVNTDGWPGEIRTTQSNSWGKLKNIPGGGFVYTPLNELSVWGQVMNPLDNQVTNLDGTLTTQNERLGAIGAPIMVLVPYQVRRMREPVYMNGNLRIAPFGNAQRVAPWQKGYNWKGSLPHYHRRIKGPDGNTVPGGSMDWHRPWEKGF